MNAVRRVYCRTFQTVFKIALPFLPYRKPKVAGSLKRISEILKKHHCDSLLIITDSGIRQHGLCEGSGSLYCKTKAVAGSDERYSDFPLIPRYAVLDPKVTVSLLPFVLEAYGETIHKKLHHLAVAAGVAEQDTPYDVAARAFIDAVKDMKKRFGIGDTIPEIWEEDIPKLARYADKEANPLYPVPVLMSAKELEQFYYMLMEK